ncbi:MAG TPA: hypothetical protein VJ842_18820 [Pyrinomonadaceae bacterium]|nr:hypothetical protein [Pyrinomonadaceae bacterium]
MSVLPLVVFLAPAFPQFSFLSSLGLSSFIAPKSVAERNAGGQAELNKMRARIETAKHLLEREAPQTTDFVTVAVADAATSETHLLKLSKDAFLDKDAETVATASSGKTFKLRAVRPNYVNTAVRVTDAAGREFQPLVVQYPVERGGALKEVAYYAAAHPALRSPELVGGGRAYVHRMLNEAAARLAQQGKMISPEIVDAAERLCIVEHTDHKRFKTEDHASLYNEIFTLYALNAGDTYRFSVSSAGAGGMVQMIPQTYQAIRQMHPTVGLNPDFVAGMRDHSNALEAMLLYMQGTWDDLLKHEEVRQALAENVATQTELLAAGYNSNPARLHLYLERGGTYWRTLIPAETQMYLRIYASVDGLVEFKTRS